MTRGFTDFVATTLVPEHPGQTASWYAWEYLQLSDKFSDSSRAKNPVQSLANTLDKLVREGKEPRIRRERIGGVYRYFSTLKSPNASSGQEIITQFTLSSEELEDVSNLVSSGKFDNRNNAIKWLVIEGIKANRTYLNKVAEIKRQIERLKKEI
jgi:hypothetical protein